MIYDNYIQEFYYKAISQQQDPAIHEGILHTPRLDKAFNAYIEERRLEREEQDKLFDLVMLHASEFEAFGFEQGFKLGMRLAAAALTPNATNTTR